MKNITAVQPRLYPVKIAAQLLGVSIWTVRQAAYKGEVASAKIGAKLLIPASEIDRVVNESTRPRIAK